MWKERIESEAWEEEEEEEERSSLFQGDGVQWGSADGCGGVGVRCMSSVGMQSRVSPTIGGPGFALLRAFPPHGQALPLFCDLHTNVGG